MPSILTGSLSPAARHSGVLGNLVSGDDDHGGVEITPLHPDRFC
jgi:hypothetical protein